MGNLEMAGVAGRRRRPAAVPLELYMALYDRKLGIGDRHRAVFGAARALLWRLAEKEIENHQVMAMAWR